MRLSHHPGRTQYAANDVSATQPHASQPKRESRARQEIKAQQKKTRGGRREGSCGVSEEVARAGQREELATGLTFSLLELSSFSVELFVQRLSKLPFSASELSSFSVVQSPL